MKVSRLIRNILLMIVGKPYTDTYVIKVNGKKEVRYVYGWVWDGKFYPKEEE